MEHVGQIAFQVADGGRQRLKIRVQADAHALIFHFQGLRHAHDGIQRMPRGFFDRLAAADLQQNFVQFRNQHGRQGPVFLRFDRQAHEFLPLGVPGYAVQQNRFADAPQPHQQKTLGVPPGFDAAQADVDLLKQRIPAGQFGRRVAGTGDIWISGGVHARVITSLSRFIKFPIRLDKLGSNGGSPVPECGSYNKVNPVYVKMYKPS